MKTTKLTRWGFTLIELLVVIAIIAILAAILFPVFARARAKAQAASCLSNIKEIALADQMYAADFDNYLVPGEGDVKTGADPGYALWPTWLFPYVKEWGLYKCPTLPNIANSSYDHDGGTKPIYCGYGVNDCASCTTGPLEMGVSVPLPNAGWFIMRPKVSHIVDPVNTIDFLDSENVTTPLTGSNCFYAGPGTNPATTTVAKRHNDGTNVAFCDGHAKWMSQVAAMNILLWQASPAP